MFWSNEHKSCTGMNESSQVFECFFNSHVLVKREQDLNESRVESSTERLYENFLNSPVLVKREQELVSNLSQLIIINFLIRTSHRPAHHYWRNHCVPYSHCCRLKRLSNGWIGQWIVC